MNQTKFKIDNEGKEICPSCGKSYVNVEKHLKTSTLCEKAYESMLTKDEEDEDGSIDDLAKELEIGSDDDENNAGTTRDQVHGGGNAVPAQSRRTRSIKYTKDLPLDEINGISTEGSAKLKKWLADHNYNVVRQLANAKIEDITLKGLGEARIKQVIDMARKEIGVYFMTPVSEIPSDYELLTTGVEGIDDLLGGGFRTGDSYELYGPFGCGKSQLGLQAAVRLQLPIEKGGLADPNDPDGDPQCLWIDTEKTMKGIVEKGRITNHSRLDDVSMAQFIKAYPELEGDPLFEEKMNDFVVKVNKNTLISDVESSEQQMSIVDDVMKRIDEFNIRLIVLDSLITHFRAEFIGRGSLSDRQQKLNSHIHGLHRLAGNAGVLIVTNQVQANPDGMSYLPAAFNFDATGGHVVKHNFNIRCKVRKGKGGSIHMELIDSSYLPNKETDFVINHRGIESLEE